MKQFNTKYQIKYTYKPLAAHLPNCPWAAPRTAWTPCPWWHRAHPGPTRSSCGWSAPDCWRWRWRTAQTLRRPWLWHCGPPEGGGGGGGCCGLLFVVATTNRRGFGYLWSNDRKKYSILPFLEQNDLGIRTYFSQFVVIANISYRQSALFFRGDDAKLMLTVPPIYTSTSISIWIL